MLQRWLQKLNIEPILGTLIAILFMLLVVWAGLELYNWLRRRRLGEDADIEGPPYADLHVHSLHSDGTMDVKEIVRTARMAGVELLAVADHNVLAGSRELVRQAPKGMRFLSAVELDCVEGDCHLHVLGYGVDLQSEAFTAFVYAQRQALDGMSDTLITRMAENCDQVSLEAFHAFEPTPGVGGWKALEYLLEAGVTASLKEGMALYTAYGCRYQEAGFAGAKDTIDAIHAAGGKAVLAHPGISLEQEALEDMLEHLFALGLDGVECYYPGHSQQAERACLDSCRQHHALITAGSDCHGTFGDTAIGQNRVPIHKLELGDLLEKKP
nr:PHP domain-containing protein [bacterium]